MTKVQKISSRDHVRRFLPSFLLAVLAFLVFASPAIALDLNPANYFQINYSPITFDKSEVAPGEAFHTTIIGQAVCMKSIPVPVSRASITSRVIARPAAGGQYTVNSGFTIDIDPFPNKAGETYDINVPLTLRFPAGASPGRYEVVWQPVEATARISFVNTNVLDNIPAEQAMGAITVTAPRTTTPALPSTVTVPPPPPPFTVGPTTQSNQSVFTGWFILLLVFGGLVVAAVIIIVVLLVLRRRD